MRSRRSSLPTLALTSLTTFVAVAASARAVHANPGITGYSGKPYNGTSETCTTNCHTAGANPPTVTITLPATVQAGSTTDVVIVVAGNRTRTSMNAAFSEGVQTIKGQNTDTPLGAAEPTEVGATDPPPAGASATYRLKFIAPNKNGTLTMWVSGMAASGSGPGGDAVTSTKQTFVVTGADAGAATDGGSSGSSGTSGSSGSSGSSGTSGSSGDTSSSSGRPETSGDSGCTVVPAASGRAGAGFVAAALAFALSLSAIARRTTRIRR